MYCVASRVHRSGAGRHHLYYWYPECRDAIYISFATATSSHCWQPPSENDGFGTLKLNLPLALSRYICSQRCTRSYYSSGWLTNFKGAVVPCLTLEGPFPRSSVPSHSILQCFFIPLRERPSWIKSIASQNVLVLTVRLHRTLAQEKKEAVR